MFINYNLIFKIPIISTIIVLECSLEGYMLNK